MTPTKSFCIKTFFLSFTITIVAVVVVVVVVEVVVVVVVVVPTRCLEGPWVGMQVPGFRPWHCRGSIGFMI